MGDLRKNDIIWVGDRTKFLMANEVSTSFDERKMKVVEAVENGEPLFVKSINKLPFILGFTRKRVSHCSSPINCGHEKKILDIYRELFDSEKFSSDNIMLDPSRSFTPEDSTSALDSDASNPNSGSEETNETDSSSAAEESQDRTESSEESKSSLLLVFLMLIVGARIMSCYLARQAAPEPLLGRWMPCH